MAQKKIVLAEKKDLIMKPQLALIPYEAEVLEALGWGYGAYVKYRDVGGAWNWTAGRPFTQVASSLRHHLGAWMDREIIDVESGVHHLGLARCNLSMLIAWEAMGRTDIDDRRPAHTVTFHTPKEK